MWLRIDNHLFKKPFFFLFLKTTEKKIIDISSILTIENREKVRRFFIEQWIYATYVRVTSHHLTASVCVCASNHSNLICVRLLKQKRRKNANVHRCVNASASVQINFHPSFSRGEPRCHSNDIEISVLFIYFLLFVCMRVIITLPLLNYTFYSFWMMDISYRLLLSSNPCSSLE